MEHIFEVTDISNRLIRLTKERWQHISKEHPQITNIEELKRTLTLPLKITSNTYDPNAVKYYYRYLKSNKRYLFVAVKYLNGTGFVITSFFRRNIT